MLLFDIFRPERGKKRKEELKILLQLNPQYFKALKKIKLERDTKGYI
ncbi:MAG: hypothetical protein ACFFG0_23505 [Candidatus Thorarchaeota archaeon]